MYYSRSFLLNNNGHIYTSQAVAALLISVSPNLQSFSFPEISLTTSPPSETGLVLQALLEHANANPTKVPYLLNLREVHCLGNRDYLTSDERYYELYDLYQNIKLVGNLPAIESISANVIDDQLAETNLRRHTTNFKRITIHHLQCSSGGLAMIMRSCRRLEEFEYSIGGRALNDMTHPVMDRSTC